MAMCFKNNDNNNQLPKFSTYPLPLKQCQWQCSSEMQIHRDKQKEVTKADDSLIMLLAHTSLLPFGSRDSADGQEALNSE